MNPALAGFGSRVRGTHHDHSFNTPIGWSVPRTRYRPIRAVPRVRGTDQQSKGKGNWSWSVPRTLISVYRPGAAGVGGHGTQQRIEEAADGLLADR